MGPGSISHKLGCTWPLTNLLPLDQSLWIFHFGQVHPDGLGVGRERDIVDAATPFPGRFHLCYNPGHENSAAW